jgi:hypothetical protein
VSLTASADGCYGRGVAALPSACVIGAGSSGIAEVDFDDYLYALRKELRTGAQRARVARFHLPVAPRAHGVGPVAPAAG